jgi:hypothetical protein
LQDGQPLLGLCPLVPVLLAPRRCGKGPGVVLDRLCTVALGLPRLAAAEVGDWAGRTEPEGLVVVRYRLVVIALLAVGVATIVEYGGLARIEADGLAEVCDGTIVVLFQIVARASASVSGVILRIEPNRLLVVRDGSVVLSFGLVGSAPVRIEEGELGRRCSVLDACVQISNRAVIISFRGIDRCAGAIGGGWARIEPDRLVQMRERAIVLAFAVVGSAQIPIQDGKGVGRGWPELDACVQIGDRAIVISLADVNPGAVAVSVDKARIEPYRFVQVCERAVKIALFYVGAPAIVVVGGLSR